MKPTFPGHIRCTVLRNTYHPRCLSKKTFREGCPSARLKPPFQPVPLSALSPNTQQAQVCRWLGQVPALLWDTSCHLPRVLVWYAAARAAPGGLKGQKVRRLSGAVSMAAYNSAQLLSKGQDFILRRTSQNAIQKAGSELLAAGHALANVWSHRRIKYSTARHN